MVHKIRRKFFLLIIPLLFFGLSVFLTQHIQPTKIQEETDFYSKTSVATNFTNEVKKTFPTAVEELEKRTRNSKTFLLGTLPDGSKQYSLDSSLDLVHYVGANGNWEEIDTALISASGEWDYKMEKAGYSFFVK